MLEFIYLLAATGAIGNADAGRPVSTPRLAMFERLDKPIVIPPPQSARPKPIPKGNPGAWANMNDYPAIALQKELEGTTGFRVAVGPDGRVTDCEIISSSGAAELDQATCTNITRRARFDPALDVRGNPTVGTYQNRIRWQIPSIATMASMPLQNESYPRAPQLRNPYALRVAKEDYPASARAALQEGSAVFTLDIDNSGVVRSCAITKSTGFPELDNQSCALAQKWQFDPACNLAGEPVAGRTSHNITWRLPKGAINAAPNIQRPLIDPFENSGTLTATLDFDKEGKLSDCVFEHKGDLPIFGSPSNASDAFCKNGMLRGGIKPFTDAKGTAHPRRVIVKISVDHAEVPEKPIEDKTLPSG